MVPYGTPGIGAIWHHRGVVLYWFHMAHLATDFRGVARGGQGRQVPPSAKRTYFFSKDIYGAKANWRVHD